MLTFEQIARWPGKSARNGGIEHPAIYHMLDVAAVAETVLYPASRLDPRKQALVLLTALHDIGKLNTGFRSMLRGEGQQSYRHWQLTEVHLDANIERLARALKFDKPSRLWHVIAATAGHHGRPSDLADHQRQRAARAACLDAEAKKDASETIEAFAALWPEASLQGMKASEFQTLSWWLSGLVTTADWIGSNTEWFQPALPEQTLSEYLEKARETAADAVRCAGISPVAPSSRAIIDWPTLRPMQEACQVVKLPKGPTLAIIEDETGAGKTEAALMLAQGMLSDGKAQGMFFALPTMATADAMFSRVSQQIGRMFTGLPTVTLAHGRAGLSDEYRDILYGNPNAPDDVSCTDWLSDSRRRALLANVGVGTIDQALLAVLPVKFQTLRYYGLSSKILIVDEVHELGEAYVAEILVALLEMHRVAGGSAILLTATLPMALRARLLDTYGGKDDGDPAYPALTIANGEARRDLPQVTGQKGEVRVERLASSDVALSLMRERALQGASCVWVRNAVDDAIAAVAALRADGIEADLLHARYALGDRKRIEGIARDRFGKNGTDRAGRVLVGTQVLESSLDLDFDVMVSDLAPMAGLIQRVGRLWRHMEIRPVASRPVPEPVLYVISSDPAQVDHDRWLSDVLDKGAYVYSADLMWRTAYHLFDEGRIVAPSGIRSLIERAYSVRPETPEAMERFERERLGKEMSHASLAAQNAVKLKDGYRVGGKANDDATYPTRLGPEQQVLVLAKETDGHLVPFFEGADGWVMSEVSVAKHKFDELERPDQEAGNIKEITMAWPEWRRKAHIICPVAEGGEICEGLRYLSECGLLFVPRSLGMNR